MVQATESPRSYTGKAIFAILPLLVGCAATGPHDEARPQLDRETLLGGPPELAAPEPRVDVLELDDEMRAYLAARVPADAPDRQKADMLLRSFFAVDGIRVRYSSLNTGTAKETFHSREGNCLAFTNLFVAMARELGLRAYFQEVDTPPKWDRRGRLYTFSRHINVLIHYMYADDQVVDFDMARFSETYPRRRISDDAALARYHNNMSVHWLLEEDARRSLAHQRLALRLSPRSDYLWTNLGAVYFHFGYADYAEASFLTALSYDRDDPLAIVNLARLYESRGERELAAYYDRRAEPFRRRNPFYLFGLAQQHYAGGDYLRAREELVDAIRIQQGEHAFHRLLGLTEFSLGEPELARRNFELALEYAREPELQARYSRELAMHDPGGNR
jgi:tetratricopeptide (TPR) repeat protein